MDDLRLQDPTAELDHPVDWADWLQEGETITGADFTLVPDASPTSLITDDDFDDTSTTATVAGLTFGQVYRLEHTIETSAGRTDTRSLTIRCGPR